MTTAINGRATARALTILWAVLMTGSVYSDDAPVVLHCELDVAEAIVGDPVIVRARIVNERDEPISLLGGVPTIHSGGLSFQWRKTTEGGWTTFHASHVIIEPGVRNPGAMVRMEPGQEFVYYHCLAYHRLPPPPAGLPTPQEHMRALDKTGEIEFRAVAKIGEYAVLYSMPTTVKVREPSEGRWVALELGGELIEKASPLDSPGLSYGNVYRAENVQRYLGESRAAWLLKWKSAWATWIESEDLNRPRSARETIIDMRDKEKGIAREVLTLSLAHGYLRKGDLKRARSEAEAVPEGSLDRWILLLRITDAESANKAAAVRKE